MSDRRRRSWWGWGDVDAALDDAAVGGLGQVLAQRFGVTPPDPATPVDPASLTLPRPRVVAPDALVDLVGDAPEDRLRHGHGNSYREVVRALHGDVPHPPDLVVRPRDADDVARVLDWCTDRGVACIPFGGGTSVVGGVTPGPEPTVSLDLERLDRVLEIDPVSGAAHAQAGALGPHLEDQLRTSGWTLRFYPQSFEFSTLGGWIATRAAGHFATGPTRVDDLVEAVAAVTPAGRWASRRLPASGAGPSPDRTLLGSEGILGVITDAWVRIQRRPQGRAQATLTFATQTAALGGVRALVQEGLRPANCRLLDPTEALLSGAAPATGDEGGDPGEGQWVLVLGFEGVADEGATGVLEAEVARAITVACDHGATVADGPTVRHGDATGTAEGGAGAWRAAFLQAPYLRDGLVRLGAVAETFETATTWDRADDLVTTLRDTATRAAREVCGDALVAVRTTHAYPDGIAPYLTVVAPNPTGRVDADGARSSAAAWDEVKTAVGEAIHAAGATATHHHAVGRDHRPVYDRQRPEPFATALRAAKAALDPAGILNPGVLIDPVRSALGPTDPVRSALGPTDPVRSEPPTTPEPPP